MLATTGLWKRYRPDQWAVRDATIRVPDGALVMLLGANGAGKTTTINCLLDFVRPTLGRATVDDVDVALRPLHARRRLAFLAESPAVYPALSGIHNVRFFAGLGSAQRLGAAQAAALLERMGVPSEATTRPAREYSKGMRQKLGLAIALGRGARNLILDEPTTGLDPSAVRELFATLRALRAEGHAILMSTHDVHRAASDADVAYVMKAGAVIAEYDRAALAGLDLEREYLRVMVDA